VREIDEELAENSAAILAWLKSTTLSAARFSKKLLQG
jgi:hypothetical protein